MQKTNNGLYIVLLVLALGLVIIPPIAFASGTHNEIPDFQIGQTVVTTDKYPETFHDDGIANKILQIVDMNSELLRVQDEDGNEYVLSYEWLEPLPMELSEDWVFGNPFKVNDYVCSTPGSLRESFPDEGVVAEVDGDFISLLYWENYGPVERTDMINWQHFQFCEQP